MATFFKIPDSSPSFSRKDLREATDPSMGVSTSLGAGTEEKSSSSLGVLSASTFQALPLGAFTKVSSPISRGHKNSSDSDPPMGPEKARTMT